MNSDFTSDVDALFRKFIPNAEPDKKLVKYWANALAKNDKDMPQLLAYIAKHTDYVNYVKYTFIDMYYDHLSTSEHIDIGKLFDKMMVAQDADKPITHEDVWQWLCNTEMFERQYTDIVTKMFLTLHNRAPVSTEVQVFLAKLKGNRAYSVEMLQRDIGAVGNLGDVSSIDMNAESTPAANQGDTEIVNDTTPNADPYARYRTDFDIIAEYEDAFQRNMNVREYILYIDELRDAKISNCLRDHIKTLLTAFNTIFTRVKEIMHAYLDTYVTEDDFIRKYLAHAHDPHFLEDLKRELFDSDAYKSKMAERLKAIYFSMYGEKMSPEDATYMFRYVKANEVELISDDLNQIVAVFKAENDEVVQRVFDIFFDVFDREPDAPEQVKYLAFIRDRKAAWDADGEEGDPFEDIKDDIVLDLKQSLEYNDILKKKITKAYAKFSEDALFPSKVYHVLDKVVPVKHHKDIDQRIEAAVQEMLLDA